MNRVLIITDAASICLLFDEAYGRDVTTTSVLISLPLLFDRRGGAATLRLDSTEGWVTIMPRLAYTGRVPSMPRRLVWLGDTLNAVREFPPGVRQKVGFALFQAQIGQKHESAKLLHGFEVQVLEVRASDLSGTYRAVYTVRFEDGVYVLHAFQKKSKSGITTPRREIELIRQRLKMAQTLAGQAEV